MNRTPHNFKWIVRGCFSGRIYSLFFDFHHHPGFKLHAHFIVIHYNSLNHSFDKRFVKFGEFSGLRFDEIVELFESVDLVIAGSTVGESLLFKFPVVEDFFSNGIVFFLVVSFVYEFLLKFQKMLINFNL